MDTSLSEECLKREMNTLDKSISFFADREWHNIMNPDRIEFLISQSYEKFVKIKDQNRRIAFIEQAKKTSLLFRSYLLDKRINLLMKKVVGKQMSGLMTHVIFKHKSSKFSKMSGSLTKIIHIQEWKKIYVTANLFIQKAFKKNGGLYLYPGSHKLGLLKFENFLVIMQKVIKDLGIE